MSDHSIKNEKMFYLAKEDGEKAFIKTINNSVHKPVMLFQAFGDEDRLGHYDIKMLEYDELCNGVAWHYVDVKDVEEKNFNTGNYVLRKPFIEFHDELKPYGYYVAFRLVEDNRRTGKFVLANTLEMLAKCNIINKGDFYLVSLAEVKEKCNCRLVQEEEI